MYVVWLFGWEDVKVFVELVCCMYLVVVEELIFVLLIIGEV